MLQTVCRSLEEFCSLLSVILQWHGKLQDPQGQGFFVESECTPSTNRNLYANTW